jgi:hypothetical protein
MAPTLQDVSFLLGLPLHGDVAGPRVVLASWLDDLEARFAGVDRREELGPIEPQPVMAGPYKAWMLQFQVRDFIWSNLYRYYCFYF